MFHDVVDLPSATRILDADELTKVAGGCPCGGANNCPCWSATLVQPGQPAPAGSVYLDSIPRGAIFIKPAPCLN
jgi:hypothetical protein